MGVKIVAFDILSNQRNFFLVHRTLHWYVVLLRRVLCTYGDKKACPDPAEMREKDHQKIKAENIVFLPAIAGLEIVMLMSIRFIINKVGINLNKF